MDSKFMRILYIVPEFEEGGAEIHVLNLINALLKHDHEITLATTGGKLEAQLPEKVHVLHMPAERKNLFTIFYCAMKLSRLNKNFHWDIIHAHSRVPAWVAWLTSKFTGIKWLMTAHALYSLNPGLIPLKHADGVICVSEAVKNHLRDYLPSDYTVIPNGIILPKLRHKDFPHEHMKFLTVGRLTRLKGLDVVLRALAGLKNYEWTLDILGEGPQHEELEILSHELDLDQRVNFHGDTSKDDVDLFMAKSSCLLFPSYQEGMGLVVLEALASGLPVIASDLEALHEIAQGELIPAGDVGKWQEAIKKFMIEGVASPLSFDKVITIDEMAREIVEYYSQILLRDRQ